jgi:hypothetical protein
LAFHARYPTELLVIEIKGLLGVDEVNEVEHATKEMIIGQEQLRNILMFLREAHPLPKAALWQAVRWNAVQYYYGIVLTPNVQPNSSYDHTQFPAIAFDSVTRYYYEQDFRSPARIWKTSRDKRWLKKYSNPETTYMPLQVGELTYEIPISHLD